ncbi:MAG TPA: hypothetical protein VGT78_02690 [Rhizomicrobium sp.]|nr:hypothetical protein [Rhizomicrobium sp.]
MPSLLGIAAAAIAIGVVNSPSLPPAATQPAPQVVAHADSSGAVAPPRQQDRIETAAVSSTH